LLVVGFDNEVGRALPRLRSWPRARQRVSRRHECRRPGRPVRSLRPLRRRVAL